MAKLKLMRHSSHASPDFSDLLVHLLHSWRKILAASCSSRPLSFKLGLSLRSAIFFQVGGDLRNVGTLDRKRCTVRCSYSAKRVSAVIHVSGVTR